MKTKTEFTIQKIKREHTSSIVAIDAFHSGEEKPEYWENRLAPFLKRNRNLSPAPLGYVAFCEQEVIGYVLAEARAWEFGSPLCGWIFAIGVEEQWSRRGVALALSRKVCAKFKTQGIHTIRTMVRRDSIGLLSFFRSSGFQAGPFVELELKLQ